VAELLESPLRPLDLFLTADVPERDRLTAAAEAAGAAVFEVPERVAAMLATTTSSQGVAATARMPRAELPAGASLVVVLAAVRDPGNAGTIVRSARAAGADAVVFARGSVDPFHPKTVRAAAGALFHLPVVRDLSAEESVARLKERGIAVLGTDAQAGTAYDEVDMTASVALVLGNEAWGVPDEVRSLMDGFVAVPMPGPMESLNVAIAASLLLFEAVRQRRDR